MASAMTPERTLQPALPDNVGQGPSTEPRRLEILLYASVPDASMLDQGFYAAEADGLREHPAVARAWASNSLEAVRTGSYDALLSFFYSWSAPAAAIARWRGKPVVVTGGGEQVFRGTGSTIGNYILRLAAFQATALFANRVLATSTSDYRRMRQLAVLARNRIGLSFHGAPAVDRFSRESFGRPRAPGSLITICGMDTELNIRRKGLYDALELLARFVAVEPASTLTVIGRTTCQALVEDHARKLDVLPNVRFAGYVSEDEKLALLGQSRFYVQLSEYEGFGIGALEALAQGCQVIHTGAGGLADTIGDYGIVLQRGAVSRFDPRSIPGYDPDLERLAAHLEQFQVARRAAAIVEAFESGML